MNPATGSTDKSSLLLGVIRLMRPRQWIKNGFVLAPLLFSGEFTDATSVVDALIATLLFCFASSAVYIVNDYHDIEQDRRHPEKSRSRPLASGQVPKAWAPLLLLLPLAVLVWGWFRQPEVTLVIIAYLVLNLAYTFHLKYQPVIDLFTIAIGFVLRVYAGATALTVPVSSWMFVTTLCLALYFAAIKRRQELLVQGSDSRKVLAHYSVALVSRYAEMAGTGALVFYGLFVVTSRPELIITMPLVLYGLFRYWYLVESMDAGESPVDTLMSDWQLPLILAAWAVACLWALWPTAGA